MNLFELLWAVAIITFVISVIGECIRLPRWATLLATLLIVGIFYAFLWRQGRAKGKGSSDEGEDRR